MSGVSSTTIRPIGGAEDLGGAGSASAPQSNPYPTIQPQPHNPEYPGIGPIPKPPCTSRSPGALRVDRIVADAGPLQRGEISAEVRDLMDFLENSPTPWQAVQQMSERLEAAGFQYLPEGQPWSRLQAGMKGYTTRNGSSLCAFIIPQEFQSAVIVGAHTDSPCLKVKTNPDASTNMGRIAVDVYGGPILTSWINRDLGLAGYLVVRDVSGKLQKRLVHIKEPVGIIPSLPPHLDASLVREMKIQEQKDLPVCMGVNTRLSLEEILRQTDHLKEGEELVSKELFFVPTQPPECLGLDKDQLASWRLDNLLGTHSGLMALLQQEDRISGGQLKVLVAWDNEEVGSETVQGAQSPFLRDVLKKLVKGYRNPYHKSFRDLIRSSLLISNDVAHGLNPNSPEFFEAKHAPTLGGGVTLKLNPQQHYATNAMTEAFVREACREAEVPVQAFQVKGGSRCGTTIGPLVATSLGLQTVDVGCPCLSMHSIREVCCPKDHDYMIAFQKQALKMTPQVDLMDR